MMANANEESSRARNPNDNSTSEVGYVPFITMQEHLTVMRELIQTLVQKPKEKPKNLSLPRFNPEIAGSDSAAWCAVVNLYMKENPLQGSALFSALSSALEGSAAQWLTQVLVGREVTWTKFKDLFIARFGGRETATSALMKMSNEKPLKDETLGVQRRETTSETTAAQRLTSQLTVILRAGRTTRP